MKKILYNDSLGKEWIDWVESQNPDGSREKEIYPLIKAWLFQIKPKSLLDIGCGQGACSSLVGDQIKYTGIDISPTLIARARNLYQSSDKKFVEGDILNLPTEDNSTDSAMAIWTWSHIDNLEQASKEMSRVLKPNGNFLIITANPGTYDVRKTFYKSYSEKGNLLTGTFDLGDRKVLSNSTLYLHNRNDIESAIKSSGLVIDSIEELSLVEPSNKGLYISIKGHK